MFDDSEIRPVGLEDEDAFEASMIFGSDDEAAGDETIVLPDEQGDSGNRNNDDERGNQRGFPLATGIVGENLVDLFRQLPHH